MIDTGTGIWDTIFGFSSCSMHGYVFVGILAHQASATVVVFNFLRGVFAKLHPSYYEFGLRSLRYETENPSDLEHLETDRKFHHYR